MTKGWDMTIIPISKIEVNAGTFLRENQIYLLYLKNISDTKLRSGRTNKGNTELSINIEKT